MNEEEIDRASAGSHGAQANDLFDEAERLQRAANELETDHERHEAMKEVNSKDMEAVAHLREASRITTEETAAQHADIRRQLDELRSEKD